MFSTKDKPSPLAAHQSMPRTRQLIFVVSLCVLSWIGMMAIHELGHVVGAVCTGGKVQRVVLSIASISRTDVEPNPCPGVVVWLGPVVGSILPILIWALVPRSTASWHKIPQFFAGFCLVANGAYIAIGAADRVGDCGVMLNHGAQTWMLWAFGAATIPTGFYLWHRLGSLRDFLCSPQKVKASDAYSLLSVAALVTAATWLLSS